MKKGFRVVLYDIYINTYLVLQSPYDCTKHTCECRSLRERMTFVCMCGGGEKGGLKGRVCVCVCVRIESLWVTPLK